ADQILHNKINSGDKIVFSISASGLTTGTALYVFDDLPDRLRKMELQQSPAQKISPAKSISPDAKNETPRIRIESVGTIPGKDTERKKSMELLRQAAKNCFSKSSYQCGDIGLLIYSGVYRSDYVMEPANAALLAGELDMNATTACPDNQKTFAFDIFNGALGFLNGCYVAQQMIAAGNCKTAMIVAAEIDNNTDSFPGEGLGICETGSAIILDSQSPDHTGFSRFLFRYHDESINAYTTYADTSERELYLNISKEASLESFYIECILPSVQEILELEKLDISRINMIFPPQISSGFIARLSEALHLPLQRFINVVGEGPDLFSSSLPYAMEQAYKKELIKKGDTGLIIAVGSGIQAGCAIYHF
ncbi:MAG TPA: 3-oxoacyl-[acyl-carrier-protein] synthase III C-terminal domain-containing protein, partial [Chitinophagaceae bacterium]|nr:3-oxoacyl-[acyl-carrier-protein] synthase III C-terminal domain-containing protein [Chitinophagaceae bacterium]